MTGETTSRSGDPIMKVCGKDVIVKGRLIRVAQLDGDKYNSPDDPETLIHELGKSRKRIDLFTFLQKLPVSVPKYPYPFEWDNLAVLPISTFEHWWNHQIRSLPRNRARQAEKKGVTVREVDCDEFFIQGMCQIYNESPLRQGKRFPHYGMTIDTARDYARTFPERSIYIGAFFGDVLIGFAKLVLNETGQHACLVHILSMIAHKDKAPTNAILAFAIKTCASRGISHLVYENFSYGKKQGDSLSHFKEINGFGRMDLPRYYVPLTPWGALAFRMRLHRRFSELLPEPVAARLREFRTRWYSHRFQLKAESF